MRCEYCKCLRFEHRGFKTAKEAHLQNTSVMSPSVSARISPIRPLYNKVRGNKKRREENKSDEAKDWNVYYVSKHHESLEALEASANAGCDLCCLLQGGLCEPLDAEARGRHYLELGLTDVRIYWSGTEEPIEESERRGVTGQMQNRLTVECGSDRFMPLGLFESRWKTNEDTSKHDAVDDTHTGSQQCFQLAQDWVSHCQSNHRGCRVNPHLETTLPNRVINVGTLDECMLYPEPFLDTPGLLHERYATLSHRWGGVTPARTTLDTIGSKLTLSSLPKTFQDAITITREMGLKYLWIDSLCIIQDSEEDWKRESRRMGDYYWYAYFNIAASDASDPTKGCFRARNPASAKGCKVDISFPGKLCEQVTTAHLIPLINDDCDWRSKVNSCLDPRGWILQERILAARTLFYGRFQLSFCCAVEDASESVEQGRLFFSSSRKGQRNERDQIFREIQSSLRGPAYGPQSRLWIIVQPKPTKTHPNWEAEYLQYPKSKTELRLCNQWLQLVEQYSALELTVPTDKLYAISGLAALFSGKLKVSSCAGMLCSDFRRSLLWRVEDGNPHSAYRLEPALAPSWSWASIKCEKLRFIYTADLGIEDSMISIIENVSQYQVNTHTSKEGTLQMRGYLLPGLVTAPLIKVLDFWDGRNQTSWRRDIEAPRVVDPDNRVVIGEFHPDTWDIVGGDSGEILLPKERIWCLPITGKVRMMDARVPGTSFVTFLGLKRVEGGEKNVFSRVGLGNGFFSHGCFEGEMERLFIV